MAHWDEKLGLMRLMVVLARLKLWDQTKRGTLDTSKISDCAYTRVKHNLLNRHYNG